MVPTGQALLDLHKALPFAFIDPRDKRIYETIEINDRVWMADNLSFDMDGVGWYYDNRPHRLIPPSHSLPSLFARSMTPS